MKKILALSLVVLMLISLVGCKINIFAALDTVRVPAAEDMLITAGEDPATFLDDVQDYLDSGSMTDEEVIAVVDALETVYDPETLPPADVTAVEWVEIQQEAAVLAGAISIESDPETVFVVNSVVSALTGMTDESASEEMNTDQIIGDLFPPDLEEADFYIMLTNFATAADAYSAFASTIDADDDGVADDGAAEWMEGSEIGDMVQYAIVSIMITEIVSVSTPEALYAFIYDDNVTEIAGYNPDTDDPLDINELSALLDLAGITF